MNETREPANETKHTPGPWFWYEWFGGSRTYNFTAESLISCAPGTFGAFEDDRDPLNDWIGHPPVKSWPGQDPIIYAEKGDGGEIRLHVSKPNACLIAAAPDLFDACRQFIAATDAVDHVELANAVIAARAAIAKAEGRSL